MDFDSSCPDGCGHRVWEHDLGGDAKGCRYCECEINPGQTAFPLPSRHPAMFSQKPSWLLGNPLWGSGLGYAKPYGEGLLGIYVMAESLGKDEEKASRPLVGPTGKLMARMFYRTPDPETGEPLNLDRDAVRGNIVPFKPPFDKLDNIPWSMRFDLYQRCKPHWENDIRAAKPRVILAAGDVAMRALTGLSGVTKIRGAIHRSAPNSMGIPVVGTYHPAYLLRGKMHLAQVWQTDLRRALYIARHGLPPIDRTGYVLFPSGLDLARFYEEWVAAGRPPLAYDIETPHSGATKDEDPTEGAGINDDPSKIDPSYKIDRASMAWFGADGAKHVITYPWNEPYSGIARKMLSEMQLSYGWNCVGADEKVLTADLRWVPARSLRVGDKLVGFEETPKARRTRHLRESTVTTSRTIQVPGYRVSFSDGTSVVTTDNHPWLVPYAGNGANYHWVETADLKVGQLVKRHMPMWATDNSREAGYLAGFYDGEGWVSGARVGCGQNAGPTLDYVEGLHDAKGFAYYKGHPQREKDRHCYKLTIAGGKAEVCRFLGTIRPGRLLAKFKVDELGALSAPVGDAGIYVTRIEEIGVTSIQLLTTSTKTYFAGGFAMHNSDEYDNPRLEADGARIGGYHVDLMKLWHFLEPGLPMGLKNTASMFFFDVEPLWCTRELGKVDPVLYSAIDSDMTLRLGQMLVERAKRAGTWTIFERHFVQLGTVLRAMTKLGVKTDGKVRARAERRYTKVLNRLSDNLQPLIPAKVLPKKVFKSSEEALKKSGKWVEGKMVEVVRMEAPTLKTVYFYVYEGRKPLIIEKVKAVSAAAAAEGHVHAGCECEVSMLKPKSKPLSTFTLTYTKTFKRKPAQQLTKKVKALTLEEAKAKLPKGAVDVEVVLD